MHSRQNRYTEATYLLLSGKTGHRGSFLLMNSMSLSSRFAVWEGSSGAEGKRACRSWASDTGQFNNSETRWLCMEACVEGGHGGGLWSQRLTWRQKENIAKMSIQACREKTGKRIKKREAGLDYHPWLKHPCEAPEPTCFHGRGRRRRRSCNAAGWGRSWRHSPPSPGDHSGNTNVDGNHGRRSERSTRPWQTLDRD